MATYHRFLCLVFLSASLSLALPLSAAARIGPFTSAAARAPEPTEQSSDQRGANREESARADHLTAVPVRLADSTEISQADLATLKQQCEDAREALIAPLRKAAIEKCIAEKEKSAEECEQFYQDYGNGGATGPGTFRQRMFHDIPECQRLYDAEQHEAEKHLQPGSR